jgi:hypothetical protein
MPRASHFWRPTHGLPARIGPAAGLRLRLRLLSARVGVASRLQGGFFLKAIVTTVVIAGPAKAQDRPQPIADLLREALLVRGRVLDGVGGESQQ